MMEIILLLGLGTAFGLGLAFASKKLAVQVDERIDKIKELLPGANCGACGFAGCCDFASSLLADPSMISKCRICDAHARITIGAVLGVGLEEEKPKIAMIACTLGSGDKFEYMGVESCATASLLMGGFKECKHACLGLGDCVLACPFDAMTLKDHSVLIDEDKCTGCGSCVDACVKGVLKLVYRGAKVFVACNSPEGGKNVARVCKTGCVTCGLCEKACEPKAIKIQNNLAGIDYGLCNGCSACVEACKRKTILRIGPSAGGPIDISKIQ